MHCTVVGKEMHRTVVGKVSVMCSNKSADSLTKEVELAQMGSL
jgi:hypothetical protein